MSRHVCYWYQLRILEYVRNEPSLPSSERSEVKSHLETQCSECLQHYKLERRLQGLTKRRQIRGD